MPTARVPSINRKLNQLQRLYSQSSGRHFIRTGKLLLQELTLYTLLRKSTVTVTVTVARCAGHGQDKEQPCRRYDRANHRCLVFSTILLAVLVGASAICSAAFAHECNTVAYEREQNLTTLIAKAAAARNSSPFVNFGSQEEIDRLNAEIKQLCSKGEYARSLKVAEQAAKLARQEFGSTHMEYARALMNLGWHEQMTGNHKDGRNHFEESLRIQETKLGPKDPHLIPVLNNLGMLLCSQGDASSGLSVMERAYSLAEQVLGKESPDLVPALNNLAVAQAASGREEKSRAILQRAADIQSRQVSPDMQELSLTLENLSILAQRSGDLAGAELCLRRVLDIRSKQPGTPAAELAESLSNLALVEIAQSKRTTALAHLQQSLDCMEKAGLQNHLDVVPTLNNLANAKYLTGDQKTARDYVLRSAEIVDRHIQNILPSLAFAEQKYFLATLLPVQTSRLLSICTDKQDAGLVYRYLLRWKGLLIECLRWQSQLSRVMNDPAMSVDAEQLLNVRKELSNLFNKAGDMELSLWKSRMADLTAQKEQLERRLISTHKDRIGQLEDLLNEKSLKDFASLLQPGEQLIDLYAYHNIQDKPTYAAFFVSADGSVVTSRLPEGSSLDTAITDWRHQVLEGRTPDAQWQSINRSIGILVSSGITDGTKRVFISPDAGLTRIPLSLLNELQSIEVAELDSPRELAYLRMAKPSLGAGQQEQEDKSILCIGNLDFGNKHEGLVFPHLPGTARELSTLAGLALKAGWRTRLMTGTDATKTKVVEALAEATNVHLATHGFFSEGGFSAQLQELKVPEGTMVSAGAQLVRNPLAESGIVLSCSSDSQSGTPDLLTADEIVGLNPGKCRSIVLSACETGLGATENGQGVLGLRASFIAAGVHRLIMSLWKVPDESSTLLMGKFYENLLIAHEPPAMALRNAQNFVRTARNGVFKAPAHWMGWVLVGEGW